ncbi:hypothetical protein B0O99DRAFT_728684, partial [Bisporella sp. PMI_857]
RLHQLSYSNTDVLLVCFSVVCPVSFENIQFVWLDELQLLCPGIPWLLIRTETDLRPNESCQERLRNGKMKPVTMKDGNRMAKKTRGCQIHRIPGIEPG